MELVNFKCVRILSDGSLNISYKYYSNPKKILIYEKDNKNFYLNKKKILNNVSMESSSNYKKNILNKYAVNM